MEIYDETKISIAFLKQLMYTVCEINTSRGNAFVKAIRSGAKLNKGMG